MKTKRFRSSLLVIAAAALAFTAGNVVAQDSTTAAAQLATAQLAAPSPPALQLSYGVPQVLQLVQAKVSDGIIVNYIQNSGTIYSLTAGEIIYLKQQGASDNVLNAMLDQRNRLTGSTGTSATTTASSTDASAQTSAPAAPAVTYVQTAPAYVPSSTVYVIPDTQTYQYYGGPYYSYPYYGGYYGWPAVSLSFGWGGRYGGGWHGGGWHHR
jgi:hypothetical protein